MNSKPSTSFAENVEEIPLDSFEDSTDVPRNGALKRSSTDAHTSDCQPPLRVRFHSLSTRRARQFSEDGVELLTAKAHEIGHANWEGGWQNTVLKKRRKGWSPRSEEEEVKEIAQAMEEDSRLMTDDVDGEVQRRDALRELTKSLKFKKEVKNQLTLKQRSVRRASSKRISFYKSFKYSLRMKWFRFKESIKSATRDYSLWHRSIKDVEGMYGTSVGSYFHFLKSLFLMNTVVAFFTVGFLFIPQLLENKRLKSVYDDGLPPSEITTPSDVFYYENGTTSTPLLFSSQNPNSYNSSFRPLDCVTGAGWFSDTALYYGGYSTGTILVSPATNGTSSSSYNMTSAYFVTISTCFVIYFIVLFCRILKMYRENFIDTEADVNVTFVEKVFSAWDFTITEEKSAGIKKRNIFNELIELLQEYLDDDEVEGFMQRFSRKCLQAFAWFILVSFMILLSWGLYVLLNESLHTLDGEAYWSHSFEMLMYPIIVTLLMGVIPILLESISRMEKYSKPRYQLYVNLIRVFILEIVILVALVLFWYERSPGLHEELTTLHQTFSTSTYLKQTQGTQGKPEDGHHRKSNITSVECWESELGEEIYRLVVIDFIYIAISTLVVDSLKPYIVSSGKASDSILEFSIPRNSVHVIYNQTILWAGIFFCPLLPLIISIKFFILFYLQKFTVMRNLRPIDRPWRAGQTQTLFYALTLMSLILSFASYVFIIVRGYSSSSCGPFQGYTHYVDIILVMAGTSEQVFLQFFAFILKPGFILFLIFILILCVYCIRNLSEGRAQLVDVLKSQLELEMKDRVFLQRLIERVQRGEYLPRHAVSPPRSVPTTPNFPEGSVTDPKHLTKRSSFVFERRTSGAGGLFNGSPL